MIWCNCNIGTRRSQVIFAISGFDGSADAIEFAMVLFERARPFLLQKFTNHDAEPRLLRAILNKHVVHTPLLCRKGKIIAAN